jgi:hypothetical protein
MMAIGLCSPRQGGAQLRYAAPVDIEYDTDAGNGTAYSQSFWKIHAVQRTLKNGPMTLRCGSRLQYVSQVCAAFLPSLLAETKGDGERFPFLPTVQALNFTYSFCPSLRDQEIE